MKKNKPIASFFLGLSAALIKGVDRATNESVLAQTKPIVQQREDETRKWRGVSFLQHILDFYGGEQHGRTYTKENMDLSKLQQDALTNPSDVRDEKCTKQSQARCPKCDALLMLGAVGAHHNCPKCDTLLVVIQNSEWNIAQRRQLEWKTFGYAKPDEGSNMLCTGCEKPFTELSPLVVGDILQPNDICFCGECGRVNVWTGSAMALMSDEDITGLPPDVYKQVKFAQEQCRLKAAQARRKIQDKPLT